ncbi:MAG: DUF86 domain-containing protein [Bacteroidota bacterium]|nr:DUF86 domain-containing protein [Bacteroidota bacterium]
MSLSQIEYLKHILDEIEYLLKHSKGLSLDEFVKDETLQRAFVRSLEIIGEATKKLSSEIKTKYPDVEWKAIAGTRDKLIHDYFGVDFELVWDIVTTKIPILKKQIGDILHREK